MTEAHPQLLPAAVFGVLERSQLRFLDSHRRAHLAEDFLDAAIGHRIGAFRRTVGTERLLREGDPESAVLRLVSILTGEIRCKREDDRENCQRSHARSLSA